MSILRVYGAASGLDTQNIIRQLLEVERRPLRQLQARKAGLQLEREAWREINSRLRTLDSRALDLRLAGTFTALRAVSAQSEVVTATAGAAAQPAVYELVVEQTARAQRVASTVAPGFAAPLSGTFAISGVTVSVAGAQTLADIQAAINGTAGIGVSANVIDGRLVLTRRETGAANPISYAYLGGDNILQQLGLFDSAAGAVLHQELQAGRNAVVRVDGLRVERAGNVLTDVISGVELTLRQESAAPVRLEIVRDSDRALEAVRAFVEQYNAVMEFIAGNMGQGGDLRGEPALLRLQATLRQQLSQQYGAVAGYASLQDLGISTREAGGTHGFSQAGKLSLDEARLLERFTADPNAFRDLFAGEQGLGRLLSNYLQSVLAFGRGAIPVRESGLEQTMAMLERQAERFNARLEMREQQLLRQFTAMERALAGLQTQGEWLAGQLRNMGGFAAPPG
ncbi:MAG: B-type flagellar hook-associated protein 2 [Syntrophomonadaceae bacterium]|nr:B-type flagellar hook-associated protein 2 [Bacillota bacterium]